MEIPYQCAVRLVLLAFLSVSIPVSAAEGREAVRPGDALVVIAAEFGIGFRMGNGFAVGDGSLIVTARHVVYHTSGKGEHRMRAALGVVSPYLGDACDAELVAEDAELDVAVLRVPWKGHPALQLADTESILSADRLVVMSARAPLKHGPPAAIGNGADLGGVETATLPVDVVALRRREPRFILLEEGGRLGPGWSGGPILLLDGSAAAGCFTKRGRGGRTGVRETQQWGYGPALCQIRPLLQDIGAVGSLQPSDAALSRPRDAPEAFLHCVMSLAGMREKPPRIVDEEARAFLALRPDSVVALRMAGSGARSAGDYELADSLYQKALKLDPEGERTRFAYASHLKERGKKQEALEVLSELWQSGARKEHVALTMFDILSEEGAEHKQALDALTEAARENPQNGFVWFSIGACQCRLGDYSAAAPAYARAIDLLPEVGPIRGALAHALEKVGDLSRAEEHFRILLTVEPENPVVHYWLAKFLQEHRPELREEAIRGAETALGLPENHSLPRRVIEALLDRLRSGAEPGSEDEQGVPSGEKPTPEGD